MVYYFSLLEGIFLESDFWTPPHPLPKNCAKSDDGAEAFGLN